MIIYGVALPAFCSRAGFIRLDGGLLSDETNLLPREDV